MFLSAYYESFKFKSDIATAAIVAHFSAAWVNFGAGVLAKIAKEVVRVLATFAQIK